MVCAKKSKTPVSVVLLIGLVQVDGPTEDQGPHYFKMHPTEDQGPQYFKMHPTEDQGP